MLPLLLALTVSPAAHAQDFAEEAHQRMKLSFDLDEVEAILDAPEAVFQAAPQQVAQAALPLEPNSQVDSVTVFRDRALVTRRRSVDLDAGVVSVTFSGLPPGLVQGTLHASVDGGAADIVGVELLSGVDLARDQARRQALKDELEPHADELGQVRDRIEALLARRQYLRSTLLTPPSGDRPLPGLNQVRETAAYLAEAEQGISAALRKEEDRAQELDEVLSPLLVELRDPLATGLKVRVDLDLPQGGERDVSLRYQVNGAGWTPAYRARLDPADSQVALEYVAVVSQATGETWDDARLSLSAAEPWVAGDLPVLSPWLLEDGSGLVYGLGQVTGPLAGTGGSGGLVSSDMSAAVEGGGAAVWAVPGKRDVAGDGSAQRIPLGTRTFSAELELATVPRVTPQVLRTAELVYGGEAPLLPGPVESYVGSDYVGAASLGNVLPGETVALGFGADDRVRVSRELVSRNRETVGFGRRNQRWSFHYRITLQNLGESARTVDLSDQVPVSADEKVSVEVLQAGGQEAALAADPQGIAHWSLTLAPGERKSVDLAFQVTAPPGSEISYQMDMMMR